MPDLTDIVSHISQSIVASAFFTDKFFIKIPEYFKEPDIDIQQLSHHRHVFILMNLLELAGY